MTPKDCWKMVILLITVLILLVASELQAGQVQCHSVVFECLPSMDESISDRARLRAAGARGWEIDAWGAIRSGNIGKKPLDVINWTGTDANGRRDGWYDLGYYHLAYGPDDDDVLGIGIRRDDPDWLDWSIAVLYADRADHGYGIQLAEWRGRVGGTTREAARAGCEDSCLAVVAATANSSPSLIRRLGRESNWNPKFILNEYGDASEHRSNRANWLRLHVL